jgi:GxxExxY protein
MKPIDKLTEEVIGLAMELTRAGCHVDSERSLKVLYEGAVGGDFVADLLVADRLIVELKAVQELSVAHEVQAVNYLAVTGINDALLLNFGASSLQFKRKRRLPKSKSG